MKKLKIIEKDNYSNYILESTSGKKYEININFMEFKPSMGSYIYIEESLLKEKVSLNFGIVESSENIKEEELIVIVDNDSKIYLQRFYG